MLEVLYLLLKPTPLLHKPQDASDLISQDPEPP